MLFFYLSLDFFSPFSGRLLRYLWKRNRASVIKSVQGENKAKVSFTRRENKHQTAICFIHGFGGDPETTWGQFPELIRQDPVFNGWDIVSIGYNTILMPDIRGIWSGKPDIQKLADYLNSLIAHQLQPHYQRLVLIAHSMGGLVLQRALLDLPEKTRKLLIHQVFLFGTPSTGLQKAQLSRFINLQIKDLGHKSAFIQQLRADWAAQISPQPPFGLWTIAGDLDEFVPAYSALSPFDKDHREITTGNHLDIAKPDSRDHLSFNIVRTLLDSSKNYERRWNGAEVALEMRAFKEARAKLEANREDLDRRGIIDYAFSLEASGESQKAIDYLQEQLDKNDTDVMGTLAGRWKRLWLSNSTVSDAKRAMDLYDKAYQLSKEKKDHYQIFYHAINLAFLQLMYLDDLPKAQAFAHEAIAACHATEKNDYWKYATLGEASIYLQFPDEAFENYQLALKLRPPVWAKESMYIQWHRVVNRLVMRNLEKRLNALFHSAME